jgi:hypothetical protein
MGTRTSHLGRVGFESHRGRRQRRRRRAVLYGRDRLDEKDIVGEDAYYVSLGPEESHNIKLNFYPGSYEFTEAPEMERDIGIGTHEGV